MTQQEIEACPKNLKKEPPPIFGQMVGSASRKPWTLPLQAGRSTSRIREEAARKMPKQKKKVANLPDLVMVKWEDSARPISAWQWVDEYEIPQIVKCLSVGFLIAETSEALALAPNLGDVACERRQAAGIIRIPLSAVRSMVKLTS